MVLIEKLSVSINCWFLYLHKIGKWNVERALPLFYITNEHNKGTPWHINEGCLMQKKNSTVECTGYGRILAEPILQATLQMPSLNYLQITGLFFFWKTIWHAKLSLHSALTLGDWIVEWRKFRLFVLTISTLFDRRNPPCYTNLPMTKQSQSMD